MNIKPISILDLSELNRESIFLSESWLSIYQKNGITDKNFHLLGIFNKNNELVGCFYYYSFKRGKILKQLSAPPFSPHCGLFVADKSVNPSKKNTFKKNTLGLIHQYVTTQKFDLLQLPFPIDYSDMQEFVWKGYSVEPRYTYRLNLHESEEELFSSMSSERRRNINKVIKEGYYSERVFDFETAKELISLTYERKKASIESNVLTNIFEVFATDRNTICYTTFDNNKNPLATVFCVYDSKVCYYILGGHKKEGNHSGAGALAMWSAIKEAKKMNIGTFDFEGSMIPSVEKYFRGFGGEIIPFFTIKKTTLASRVAQRSH